MHASDASHTVGAASCYLEPTVPVTAVLHALRSALTKRQIQKVMMVARIAEKCL